MSKELAALIEDRSRLAVKRILDEKDRIADPHLSASARKQLRAVIIDEVSEVTRMAATLLTALEEQLRDGYALNQLWLESIAQGVGVAPPVSDDAGAI